MKSVLKPTAIFVLILLAGLPVMAQSSRGSLRGIVVDARGAAVHSARVLLLYNRQAVREATTNERGEFGFDGLKSGEYAVVVEADGLTQTGGAQPVRIEAGREFRVAIPLTVAAIEDSVIVSATRTESRTGETPASAFVVSAADLLRSQRINVFDTLRLSPGVTVAQTARRGGLTSLFVRGGKSDYTKVLIDGVPVNDAGGSFDFADLTTDNAARIELVRGAQGAIYGSDAMTGVLQLFTHRGSTRTPELEIAAEGGSFAFNRQFARFSGANRGFDYSLSFTHLRTEGRDRNDDYQNRIATANLGYDFNPRTQIRLTARNDNSGLGVPGPTARLFPDPDERAKRRRITTGVRLDDQTAKRWHQSLSFAFSESNYLSFDPAAQDLTKPGTPPDPGVAFNDFAPYFNHNHQRRRGLRYQSDLVLPSGHFISAGIDYDQERAVFDSSFGGRVAPDRTNIGAFIQDQFAYTSRMFVTVGIRAENNRDDVPANLAKILSDLGSAPYTGEIGFGTEVMPKIAAILVIRQSGLQSRRGPTRLRVNYGEGIKAPSLREAFSPDGFFALGNPALKPERSRNFDLGLEQLFWKDRIRIEGIYFKNRFHDQIAYVGDPATFAPLKLADGRLTHFINNDRATAEGFELAASWHPKRWLRFDGNYTLLDTNLDASADLFLSPEVGLPLLRRPRHSGSISLVWLGDKFDANFDGVFVGKRRDIAASRFDAQGRPIYNDGYAKLDLAGSYRFNSFVSVFARIENLLNDDYQEVLGYPAYRLNFSAGMRFRIGGGK